MTQFAYVRNVSQINRDISKAKTQGVICSAVVPVNATTQYQWAFPEERWLTGGSLLASGSWGDSVTVAIVDVDGILAPAGTVIEEFITNFYVTDIEAVQIVKEFVYPALIPAGMYIRLSYTNTSILATAKVALNIFSHIPRS